MNKRGKSGIANYDNNYFYIMRVFLPVFSINFNYLCVLFCINHFQIGFT